MQRSDLSQDGFRGFIGVAELCGGRLDEVPRERGIYAVLRVEATEPVFLARNGGGHFKGKDPTVAVSRLRERWVRGTEVLYIGATGDPLRKRIGDLCRFSEGQPVGHWGGRLLWQVTGSENFLVGWRSSVDRDPFALERELMHEFRDLFGVWPFANIQGPRKGG